MPALELFWQTLNFSLLLHAAAILLVLLGVAGLLAGLGRLLGRFGGRY